MKRKNYCNDSPSSSTTNIVLISAATVLLATCTMNAKHCCNASFISSVYYNKNYSFQQRRYNNNDFNSIIQEANNPKFTASSSSSSSSSISSTFSFELYSTPRRRRLTNQESWSKRATVSSDTTDSSSRKRSSNDDNDDDDDDNDRSRSESRFGVRRRVRSVLEKAKQRTGIRNNSEDFLNAATTTTSSSSITGSSSNFNNNGARRPSSTSISSSRSLKTMSTAPNIVADAASIGGLGAVVVDDEGGKIDVALDYVPLPTIDDENDNVETKVENISTVNETMTIASNNQQEVKEEAAAISNNNENMVVSPSLSSKATTSSTKVKKSSPASTYSPSTIKSKSLPEDSLIPAKPSRSNTNSSSSNKITEIDALKGDVSAAFSMPPPPLPFTLPKLTIEQNQQLLSGERVQFQSDMGREGSGFVAVDVKAPASVIWSCLLDFYSYPQTIPTVRDIQMFTNTHLKQDYYAETAVDRQKYEDGTLATLKHGVPSVTRAAFTLSKFRLKIAAIHKYRTHPQGDYMIFTLDPACTNMVLQNAKGVWHTQSNPDGRGEVRCQNCDSKLHPNPNLLSDFVFFFALPFLRITLVSGYYVN